MLEGLIVGQYVPGTSFLHRLSPEAKLLATTLLVMAVLLSETWPKIMVTGVFSLLTIFFSGIPPRFLARGLRPLRFLLIATLFFHLLVNQGAIIWEWGPFKISDTGLEQGVLISLRLMLLIVSASLLTLTTSPQGLTDGMARLMAPGSRLGIPVDELAIMVSIALRFIPTLVEETNRVIKAQMARGAELDRGGITNRIRSFVPVLVPLLVGAMNRAEDLAIAMEIRGYRGPGSRTQWHKKEVSWGDYVSVILTGMLVIFTLVPD